MTWDGRPANRRDQNIAQEGVTPSKNRGTKTKKCWTVTRRKKKRATQNKMTSINKWQGGDGPKGDDGNCAADGTQTRADSPKDTHWDAMDRELCRGESPATTG